ncbi:unnamed protein product [Brachionus calyciflorus]|uniref:PRELI/MSF1 domain-containing protein n=1 Tax=Brachionus calyciflorus TaxID=104777 RepID=A0A813M0F8_9BILA|nr:unnamed protein product [Brachionus calyciflorus]
MVKEYFGTFTFPFNWDIVVSGFWVKYPNPFSKHVISEDVISRTLTENNVLVSKRLLVKERNFHIPKWAEKYVTFKNVYVIEETYCDANKKTFTSFTRNFSSNSLMTVIEKSVFTVDPNNPNQTICTKQAHIYSPLLFGSGIEQFALKKFKKNADKASQGLQWILEKIQFNKFKGYC